MTDPNSSRKRQRSVTREGSDAITRPPGWDQAIDTLLERLRTIRAQASALRDEQSNRAQEIQQRIAARETASRIVAKVNPPPPSEDVDAFSKGVRVEAKRPPPDPFAVPPLPAMKLLTETDPPEKLIHEQSIIVRAQAINRKNAELARERLPKQPEAQRNKTFHDCFLEEAIWMANDFREERKWKIHMAKKVSKLVLQYHAQRESRRLRAIAEERQKMLRLAGSVARDVRKFWNQIQQIADYRHSVVEEAQRAKDEQKELEKLLQRTARYTSIVGKGLTNFIRHQTPDHISTDEQPTLAASKPDLAMRVFGTKNSFRVDSDGQLGRSNLVVQEREEAGETEEESAMEGSDKEAGDGHSCEGEEAALDDESTLIAAEAEEQRDKQEVTRLENEADMSIEDLLRCQGIDPAAYKADNKSYLEKDDEEFEDAISADSEGFPDDESTIRVAEENDVRDESELKDLEQNARLSIVELLKSQGIDPEVYQADRVRYTRDDNKTSDQHDGANAEGLNGTTSNLLLEAELPTDVGVPKKSAITSSPVMSRQKCESSQTMDNGKIKLGARPLAQNHDINLVDSISQGTSHDCNGKKYMDTGPETDKISAAAIAPGIQRIKLGIKSLQQESMFTSNSRTELDRSKPPSAARIPIELLRGTLRSYQKAGVEWLISLFNQSINGILADEMGLGKTIQAISLLAWLAVEKGIWGPHLIVVPTSVLVNWEVEFKKWLPGFKVLTYFGSVKERRLKRQGWTKTNSFHVCITSYNLAVQDATALRRKRWIYLILDEAHNIKNFESQRWQTLLSFSSQRRLLITGTPLQNSVMELWSLMHFLMPDVFESHSEFKVWFSKPLNEAAQAQAAGTDEKTKIVSALHEVLRPFLLRRLKADVEKGLPPKHEHIVRCPLSKRQRQLYEDFMASSDVQNTLQSGDFFSVMNILMQLRKVCNHPDLFEGRRILSPLAMRSVFYPVPSLVTRMFEEPSRALTYPGLCGFNICEFEKTWPGRWHTAEMVRISAEASVLNELLQIDDHEEMQRQKTGEKSLPRLTASSRAAIFCRSQIRFIAQRTGAIIRRQAILGEDLRTVCSMTPTSLAESLRFVSAIQSRFLPSTLPPLVRKFEQSVQSVMPIWERFVCCTTKVTAPIAEFRFRGDDTFYLSSQEMFEGFKRFSSQWRTLFRPFEVRSKVTIPESRLVQWDCGKLQMLDKLLRTLQSRGSRTLIFTQMTKVLDVLESFLNLHSLRYLRLDGTTKTDDRQKVVERFNSDMKIFCMILTTRAGGIGLNLTGADTVIFYDTDYNPAVDNQAQDRVHRIGQTRSVHIYRLVSEQTVEENILRRANEKRSLESIVISEAKFTPEAIALRQAPAASVPPSAQITSEQSQTEQKSNSVAADRSGIVRNGKSGELLHFQKSLNGSVSGKAIGGSAPETLLSEDVVMPVQTASGQFKGVGNTPGQDKVDKMDQSTENFETIAYQDVTSKLLAAEDDRERIAITSAEQELRDLRAEFDDITPSTVEGQKRMLNRISSVRDNLELSLTPIQRYALRLIESRQSTISRDEPQVLGDWEKEFTLEKMLVRHNDLEASRRTSDGVVIAAEFRERGVGERQERNKDDDEDPLTYELDISDFGQRSYLKALTDTDADIKLYLPLRDGGPEELKISTVVSGTAAAGLECAEDAAFFPHAYNRMSRTMYATQRQKEKARENLRKRKAEKEVKRRMELEEAAAVAAAAKEREFAAANSVQSAKAGNAVERTKITKNKTELPRAIGNIMSTKKTRAEGSVRTKGASGTANPTIGSNGASLGSNGLFKKITKKATRRLISAGKAALVASGNGMPGEGVGLNDAWTREEDMSFIRSLIHSNSNMVLVSDSLQLDPCVRAGIRRRRGYKHCGDRLVSTLQKEAKSGPLTPKATEKDADVYLKHLVQMDVANKRAQQKPPGWLALPPIPTEKHPSQVKVITEAASKSKGKFRSNVPPTLGITASFITFPKQFHPGYKPTETTPEALYRKRYPFIRSPRDEAKAGAVQRAPPSGAQSGTQQGMSAIQTRLGGADTQSRSVIKQQKAQNLLGSRSGVGSFRPVQAGTSAKTHPKVRGIGHAGVLPQMKPHSVATIKKDTLRTMTGGRVSIGHIGSGVLPIQKPTENGAGMAIREANTNKAVTKVGRQVQIGKSSAATSRLPAVIGMEVAGPNGITGTTGVKVLKRSTAPVAGSVEGGAVSSGTDAKKKSTESVTGNGTATAKVARKENSADVKVAKGEKTTGVVEEKRGEHKGAGVGHVQR